MTKREGGFILDANAKVHYDIALADINTPYSTPIYTVRSWQEIQGPTNWNGNENNGNGNGN